MDQWGIEEIEGQDSFVFVISNCWQRFSLRAYQKS